MCSVKQARRPRVPRNGRPGVRPFGSWRAEFILLNYIPRMKPTTSSTTTSDRLTTVLSYGALLLLIYLVFRIVEPFLEPLAWSAVLAIFFYSVHERISRRLRPNPAALVCTLGVTLLLIAPAPLVLGYTTRQTIDPTPGLGSGQSGRAPCGGRGW